MQPFNPYAPPQQGYAPPPGYGMPPPAWGQPAFRVAGVDLLVMNGADLPPVCLKCGTQHGVAKKRKNFAWAPQWVYFLLIISVLIGAIVIAIMQKRASIDVPLCDRCRSRWTMATVALVGAILALFVGLPVIGGVSAAAGMPSDGVAIFVIVMLVAWVVGIVLVSRIFVRGRTLWPRRIENSAGISWVTLAGVHGDALAQLSQYGQMNAPMPPPMAGPPGGAPPGAPGFNGQYGY